MSEKIYAWLLRLYPRSFRETYGDAGLQLLRDRSRHEPGFLLHLKLWFDLLLDLAISVPRAHVYFQSAPLAAPAPQPSDSTPCFHVLEDESLRPEVLLLGGALTVVALFGMSFVSGLAGHNRPLLFPLTDQAAPQPTVESDADSKLLQPAMFKDGNLDVADRQRVIHAAVEQLKQHYVSPDIARKMADALLAHEKNGDNNSVRNGKALADRLTQQMREVSHDPHLVAEYSPTPLPTRAPGPSPPEALARYRTQMTQSNCTIEQVELRPHNIGYLKLNSFPDPAICQPAAAVAMARLNNVDVIIFDLRDNTGGFPDMVSLLAAYLFDHPEYMYNPRENTTERSWTLSPIPGNRLADKPAYVLTSARTYSGAEQFSYDLKMLKRATLVGETTGGGAHAGSFYRLSDHFGIGIPEAKPINPFSKADWEGTGVAPDVKVNAADALTAAEKLAVSKLRPTQARATSP